MLPPDAAPRNSHDQPSSRPSSSRASSSAVRQPPPPCYLSARSADVILSEVRPTHIKTEALRSVNVFLDELLWLILGCARSFSPDRLRTGLLKVLPTVLGQDALLEAEVELRAYVERNPLGKPLPTDDTTIQKFPLQHAFELLRVKCEAYSSLGDQEENVATETALHARMVQVCGDAAPKLSAVAPASLYLTAILEHVCEHVLSNVGRVVARDSSRTTAHCQDLYVALCEDESIYSLFKTMKVQEQIEQQSQTVRPRRSKSLPRNDFTPETIISGASTDPPAVPKQRQSYDSTVSNSSNPNLSNRGSADKGRSKAIFKNSSRLDGSSNADVTKHHRTNSLLGDKKKASMNPQVASIDQRIETEDDDGMQDFDDLMRSGATMKVSLTPDRLKTFEVFAQEKNQRANRPGVPPSIRDSSSPPSSFSNGHLSHSHISRTRIQVESIAEAPEGDPVRLRAASIGHPTPPKVERAPTPRSRSFTDARAPSSLSTLRTDGLETPSTLTQTMSVTIGNSSSSGIPKQTRRQTARNRESIDLDDIMDGSDDEMINSPKKKTLMPKPQMTESGTRELLDFLSEGPPEPASAVTSPSNAAMADSRGAKQGRFRTIVSRLTGGASSERLSPRSEDPYSEPYQRFSSNGYSAPPRGPLLSKRSVPNVAAAARPVPPPISPPLENTFPASGLRSRQLSLSRKAVPTWDPLQEKEEPPIPQNSVVKQGESINVSVTKPLPQPIPTYRAQPLPDGRSEPTSPTRRRVSPREIEQPAKDNSVSDSKPSSTVIPPLSPGLRDVEQPTKVNDVASTKPTSPPPVVSEPPSAGPTDEHVNIEKDPIRESSKPPELMLSIPVDHHLHDFRRLMARATSADECRVLADMFLAQCGVLPTGEEHLSAPITPPMSPVRIEVDCHEADLIEVLLSDGGTSSLLPGTTSHTQQWSEPAEEASELGTRPVSSIINPSAVTISTA